MDILNTCIKCGACEKLCPVGISGKKIAELQTQDDIINYIYNLNPFALICSYICTSQACKNHCPKNINLQEIHNLENNSNLTINTIFDKGKVAIVGGGVSGLTASWYLLNKGYEVDLWDYSEKLGGELNLIPETRLPKDILEKNIKYITKNEHFKHVQLHFGSSDELAYDTIIYCCGCKPKTLNFLNSALTYQKYLSKPNVIENIAIIGGGKVALDCALYNKGNSTLFIRRNYWDMKLTREEFNLLLEKHISVISNFNITNITQNSNNKYELEGTINKNVYKQIFDKVIIAIGKESIKVNTEKGIVINPSNTVIETIKNTLNQLKTALHF